MEGMGGRITPQGWTTHGYQNLCQLAGRTSDQAYRQGWKPIHFGRTQTQEISEPPTGSHGHHTSSPNPCLMEV